MMRTIKDVVKFVATTNDRKTSDSASPAQFHWPSKPSSVAPPSARSNSRSNVHAMSRPIRGSDNELERLRTALAKQGSSLRKQGRRNGGLRKELQKLRRQNQQLKHDLRDAEAEKSHYQEGYEYILRGVVHPYAEKMGLLFDDSDYEDMDLVLHPLYEDAMQAKALRGRLEIASQQIKAQRHEIAISQEHIVGLKQELLATGHDLQNKREELETVYSQVHLSQERYDATQVQLQASRSHVQSLQKQMLSSVDKFIIHTDDQLNQDFRALLALVKSLSRSVRLKQHVDITTTLKPCGLLQGVANHHWSSRGRVKCYIEAWLWSVLIEKVIGGPFHVFGKLGMVLNDDWATIFGPHNTKQWPEPSPPCETWRYVTVEQLANILGRDTIARGKLDEEDHQIENGRIKNWTEMVIEARAQVANTLGAKLTSVSSSVDVSRIPHIIDKAFALRLNMSLQRSRLEVEFSAPGSKFEQNTMSPMPDSNGDEMVDGTVAFIITPGLVKWGDAHGRRLDEFHIIERSLVQLE